MAHPRSMLRKLTIAVGQLSVGRARRPRVNVSRRNEKRVLQRLSRTRDLLHILQRDTLGVALAACRSNYTLVPYCSLGQKSDGGALMRNEMSICVHVRLRRA